MCCVIPPASVETTEVLRIASSNVVLPWSTWPMIVTTGGRATRSASLSSNVSSSSSSSAACLMMISRPTSAAIISTSSSESDWVAVRIWPRLIRSLMICGIAMPTACERSLTVTPDCTFTGPVGATTGAVDLGRAVLAVAGLARVLPRPALVDHDAALAAAGHRPLAGPDRAVRLVGSVCHGFLSSQCRDAPAGDRRAASRAACG